MSTNIISENCYTCANCQVIKKICRLRNTVIQDIYKDKCISYTKRAMLKCEICGVYVVNLKNHVKQIHNITMSEYNVRIKFNESKKTILKGGSLF